jgi:hypothetical protein
MDAHAREYAGAVAGWQETYGPRFTPPKPVIRQGNVVDTWAAGDYVAFRTDDGQSRQGYVVECLDDSGYGIYHVKSHKPGGGVDHFSVDGFQIAVF